MRHDIVVEDVVVGGVVVACSGVWRGVDQPLRGGEGISRLSRKATVEKGRVPAYVTQTQREKCASTLPNSHPRPATQCARYHRQALGSHLRS